MANKFTVHEDDELTAAQARITHGECAGGDHDILWVSLDVGRTDAWELNSLCHILAEDITGLRKYVVLPLIKGTTIVFTLDDIFNNVEDARLVLADMAHKLHLQIEIGEFNVSQHMMMHGHDLNPLSEILGLHTRHLSDCIS